MERKLFWICVQSDILSPIDWCLQTFESTINAQRSDSLRVLRAAFSRTQPNALIIDSTIADESSLSFIEEVRKSHPELKILMMVSSHTTRDEVINAIKAKCVDGVLLRPFTAEQLTEYIIRFCRQA